MVKRLIAMICLLLLTVSAYAANSLQAMVDRQEISIDETVQLVIKLSGGGSGRPDLTGIYKDFSIDSHSQSSSARFINGIISQDVSWVFVLSPNRTGELVIPSLEVGGEKSQPISITVTDTPTQQASNDDALMEVELSPLHPYVQGQMIYIQRLYYSRPLVDNASISSPKIIKGKADIEFLGSSNPTYTKFNGRPYQRISRYYAVYPQEAGTLEFAPSVFRGSLARSTQRDPFQYFPSSGSRLSASSSAATVEIEPKPAAFGATEWLPASQVSLSTNWSMPPEALQAGEPVTVTIAIIAEGKRAETLPEIKLAVPAEIKSYPEKPVFQNQKSVSGIGGMRQETIVLVANQNGEYTIPAVEIPWWDTVNDKLKIARLEPVTVNVTGAVVADNAQMPTPEAAELSKVESEAASPETKPLLNPPVESVQMAARFDEWIARAQAHSRELVAGSAAFVLLVSAMAFFGRRRRKQRGSPEFQRMQMQQQSARKVIAACNANDSAAAIVALPTWAASAGMYPASLAGIESCGNPALESAVRDLSASRYARQDSSWNGNALKLAVQTYGAKASAAPVAVLRPLHPISQ